MIRALLKSDSTAERGFLLEVHRKKTAEFRPSEGDNEDSGKLAQFQTGGIS